jgi:hypothetical protein
LELVDLRLASALAGRSGVLDLTGKIVLLGGASLKLASFAVARHGRRYSAPLDITPGAALIRAKVEIPDVEPWWPHTHGEPALYEASLEFEVAASDGTQSAVEVDLGRVGFRTVTLDRSAGDFALSVNGVRIFCRGAVWTPLDCVALNASAAEYVDAIGQARAAGMNMLRVAGPLTYETDAFLDLCDSSGILLWQDFMFANMDYPAEDPDFAANVSREATQLLPRLQARPSLSVLCGNSECAQQAAMSGAARDQWAPALFETRLAAHAHEYCPDVPYCPSSTHGGDFPFSATQGVTSYYGVGAYLQPLGDARRSELKFASECLAFANVPESETLTQAADRALHFNQPVARDQWGSHVGRVCRVAPRALGLPWSAGVVPSGSVAGSGMGRHRFDRPAQSRLLLLEARVAGYRALHHRRRFQRTRAAHRERRSSARARTTAIGIVQVVRTRRASRDATALGRCAERIRAQRDATVRGLHRSVLCLPLWTALL